KSFLSVSGELLEYSSCCWPEKRLAAASTSTVMVYFTCCCQREGCENAVIKLQLSASRKNSACSGWRRRERVHHRWAGKMRLIERMRWSGGRHSARGFQWIGW